MSGWASWLSLAAFGGSLNARGWTKKSSCGAGAMAVNRCEGTRKRAVCVKIIPNPPVGGFFCHSISESKLFRGVRAELIFEVLAEQTGYAK
jgi:hypothetical protein